MGLFMRRRRPVARLAVGAATAGVAYHAGKQHAAQQQVNDQAEAAYAATQGPPQQYSQPVQYAPPPPAAPAPQQEEVSSAGELAKLADLHSSGALTDAEFSAAKSKLLGL